MARNRNKTKTKTKTSGETQVEETQVEAGTAEEIASIEALLDGDAEAQAAEELAREETRSEAYASAESTITVAGDDEAPADEGEEVAAASGKTGRAAGPKLGFQDGVVRLFAENPAVFDSEDGALDEAQLREILAGVTQVKVQDKVSNLLHAVTLGSEPSNYTKIGIDVMLRAAEGDGVVTSKAMVQAFLDKGYKQGTANAQAGQMMAMFPALKIANKTQRGILEVNPNSTILETFRG